MLSYIVILLAALVYFERPITNFFSPNHHQSTTTTTTRLSPRPKINESLLAIDPPNHPPPNCPPDTYTARILRRQPLVLYLENFLSPPERAHLLTISTPLFEPSTVVHNGPEDSPVRDSSIRDSEVALLPRTDTVRCIERRAKSLQGWRRDLSVERLRTQRYTGPSGHYAHHFDWGMNFGGWGRVSSFMVWVDDGSEESGGGEKLEGGGTEFPLLERRFGRGEEEGADYWCRFVECGGGEDERKGRVNGTTFKVVPGNAVFWENFGPDGRGYEEAWHAGLPVTKGTKVGLNIWSFGRIET